MSAPRTLYITLQYLRTDSSGQNKYHWGLYATGDSPPRGTLFHATDAGRQALDLYYEHRNVSNPLRSQSMVVCLKIGDAPSSAAIDSGHVECMSKEALNALHNNRILSLPASVGSVERACLVMADSYLPYRASYQQPGVYNDLTWLGGRISRTTPTEAYSDKYYPSEMEVDSSGRYRSSTSYGSLMDVDSSGRYGSSRSYGSSMDVDSSAGRSVYRSHRSSRH